MRKKKYSEDKDFEMQLAEVEFTDCDDGQSVELLKKLVSQFEQIIQLLTKLKERFI